MPGKAQLLPGTRGVLILKATSLGPLLAPAGRNWLREEAERWSRPAMAMASALATQPKES